MVIAGNDHLWSEKDQKEIIERAYHIYHNKRRKVALEDINRE